MQFFRRSAWDTKDVIAAIVAVVMILYLASPLWPFMQVQRVAVAFPSVSLTRTVTLPMHMQFTDQVETIDGRQVEDCDASGRAFYEARGNRPVIFDLACETLPSGSYFYTPCWVPAVLSFVMRPSCSDPIPFDVPSAEPLG
ncbi:hypothetical protein AAD018_009070 [Aestuariibius insulae]|uniref:hypothetical protein n=1 Tax=Aestuariibius insulae TaxID=2058287 RepID=UPI00345E2E78